MGTKMAPSYACLFMGSLEKKMLASAPYAPIFWKRFIDDILIIWPHGKEKMTEFLEHLNNYHETIKFDASPLSKSTSFLDVQITINNGEIETDLFSKPTDSHCYLPWSSCHPHGTKKSIPYSQALRLKRICCKPHKLSDRLHQLEGHLKARGYKHKSIKAAFERVRNTPREETLIYKKKRHFQENHFPH